MSNKTLEPSRLPPPDDDFSAAAPPPRRPRRSKRSNQSRFSFSSDPSYDRSEPRGYSLMRTRRLLMAALRVWELKNGIHSSF